MKTILDTIVDYKRQEIELLRAHNSYKDFEQGEYFQVPCRSMRKKLQSTSFGVIAELKRTSPSAGALLDKKDYLRQAQAYELGGAIGISCLTDHYFFGGSCADLAVLRKTVQLPLLRKDFMLDELQVFQAKAHGADLILLIAEILDADLAMHLTLVAQQLGMEVLMEVHDRKNVSKINELVDIIGVNNRDLHLQKTQIEKSFELFPYLPDNRPIISESGINRRSEIIALHQHGFQGALIGESILRAERPAEFLRELQIPSHAY